ncbi:MAG: class I SAM-dependent methyltransferase [Blastocatellia bacterium]
MDKHIFVDEDVNIFTGTDAKTHLEKESDAHFLSEGEGVVSVTKARWQVAQRYECRTWMTKGSHAVDDRNYTHYENFDGYKVLQGMTFNHAIELGCGPFTNLRYISESCKIEKCTLLDPLAESYLNHRNCRYTKKYLRGEQRPLFEKLSKSVVHRGIRRLLRSVLPQFLYSGIPVESVIPKPIEEYETTTKFDLIVMINVIEHCFDINAIFNEIKNMSKEGTVFIFQDKYYFHEQVSKQIMRQYDAGHPLRVDKRVVDYFLEQTFVPLFKQVKREERVVDDIDISFDSIYYIGKLK